MGYERFKVGGVEFPLSAILTDADTTLDPPITALLEYYDFELTRNLLPYWQTLLPTIGLNEYADAVVAEKLPYDPELYFQEAQYSLPLLAIFRTSEVKKEKTVHWYAWEVTAKCRFILPTLTAAQALSMMQILKGVRAIIADRTEQGYDPAYLDGYGEVINVMEDAGICSINVTEATYGHLVNPQNNLVLPTLDLTIVFEEREQMASGFEDFEGLDGYVSSNEADNTNTFVVTEFEHDIT